MVTVAFIAILQAFDNIWVTARSQIIQAFVASSSFITQPISTAVNNQSTKNVPDFYQTPFSAKAVAASRANSPAKAPFFILP